MTLFAPVSFTFTLSRQLGHDSRLLLSSNLSAVAWQIRDSAITKVSEKNRNFSSSHNHQLSKGVCENFRKRWILPLSPYHSTFCVLVLYYQNFVRELSPKKLKAVLRISCDLNKAYYRYVHCNIISDRYFQKSPRHELETDKRKFFSSGKWCMRIYQEKQHGIRWEIPIMA